MLKKRSLSPFFSFFSFTRASSFKSETNSGNSTSKFSNDDGIFSMRRDRKRKKKQRENEGLMNISNDVNNNESENEDLVSSGDDLNYNNDNEQFHIEQFDNDDDIDTQMQRMRQYETV